jgi:cell division septation protein DedD
VSMVSSVRLRRSLAAVAGVTVLLASLSSVGAFTIEPGGGGWNATAASDIAATDAAALDPAAWETAAWGTAITGAIVPGATVSGLDISEPTGHLVISELVTGGTSASDELIELYNPDPAALPVQGLELVYVTATGATITRKASWSADAAAIPPGGHLLIANGAGIYAAIADVTYTNGLAGTGGSVALRIIGAATAIDALGWGTAANAWMEGLPAAAAAAGHSLERLPGGTSGSGQDTGQNSIDFVERETPDPQNSGSPPTPVGTPSPTASPSGGPIETPTPQPSVTMTPAPSSIATSPPSATPMPTATPPQTPMPSPTPQAVVSIAAARAMPDGSTATIEGVSLTASDFTDGGGYVVDATGGIAVLVTDASFGRGATLHVTGELDDRYHQRTLRVSGADLVVLGAGSDPAPIGLATGAVGEGVEGRLVRMAGAVDGSPTQLSGALAFDVDDGSGVARVVVTDASGIDTAGWVSGSAVDLVAVVGQRDSSGTGTEGYRVMPRDPADVISLRPRATPTPTPTPNPTPTPSPSDDPGEGVVTVADARAATVGAHLRVRGVVTLPSDLHEEGSAVIQDATGAILLRLGEEAGTLSRRSFVEVDGTRSTKAGMESLRVTVPVRVIAERPEPDALRRPTGEIGEDEEALLVVVRGAIVTSVLRSTAENVYFSLDDGSGPLRVFISPRAGIASGRLQTGVWVEIRGAVTQETTGRQPERGYRLWPRADADLEILPTPPSAGPSSSPNGGSSYPLPNLDPGTTPGVAGSGGLPAFAGAGGGDAGRPGKAPELGPGGGIALALPTFSPTPGGLASQTASKAPGNQEADPLAALLLVLGGTGMAGSAFLLAPPGLTERLWALAHGGRGGAADETPDPTEPVDADATRLDLSRANPGGLDESGRFRGAAPEEVAGEDGVMPNHPTALDSVVVGADAVPRAAAAEPVPLPGVPGPRLRLVPPVGTIPGPVVTPADPPISARCSPAGPPEEPSTLRDGRILPPT